MPREWRYIEEERSVTLPVRTPPWMAAPMATASSGFMLFMGSRPKIPLTISCTGHTANEDDLADFVRLYAGLLQGFLTRIHGEVLGQKFELGTKKHLVQMFWSSHVGGDEGKADFSLQGGRQLDFGLLGGLAYTLHGDTVA